MSAPDSGAGPLPPGPLPLHFERVCFERGGRMLLQDVSFRVEHGPTSVILGPNGAGKTLVLRLACGLLTPGSGSVRWAGGAKAARESTALVFQRPLLLRRSVRANIDFVQRVRGVPRRQRARRTQEMLEYSGLLSKAGRPARTLSAGEAQRLALARASALLPRVLLLDEPAGALDPGAGKLLENNILALQKDGVKIVMTTHDLGQARRLAGEVLFIHGGRLLEQSPAAQFFERPQSEAADKFLRGEIVD